ncbi:MAG: hypothetical protein IJS60_10270 [Abditibacteriota bacterium]|nr:hypothetical protein [Abditibacteriota bacterium]
MLLILSSYLYADHWSTYNDISLSGSYPGFAAKGNYVSFMGYALDQDKRYDSNNYQYIVNDSFSYNSNSSNWNLGFSDLTNIMQSSSQSGNSFSIYYYAQLPNDISCGDYTSTITVNDNDTNDPYNITVIIYHTGAENSGTTNYNGQSQWSPVKTITLTNLTRSTQTITWDGSIDSSMISKNALSHRPVRKVPLNA